MTSRNALRERLRLAADVRIECEVDAPLLDKLHRAYALAKCGSTQPLSFPAFLAALADLGIARDMSRMQASEEKTPRHDERPGR